jgi:hypothetical protein
MKDAAEKSPDDALRKRRTTGVILLVIGSVALLSRAFDWNLGLLTPLLLGALFLVWAVLARERGLLIPGGILTGLGAGILVKRYADQGRDFDQGAFLLCFATGWLLIPLLSWVVFKRRMLWPLWPAAALTFAGLVRLGGNDVRAWLGAAREYWPVALIAVALFMLFTKPDRKM